MRMDLVCPSQKWFVTKHSSYSVQLAEAVESYCLKSADRSQFSSLCSVGSLRWGSGSNSVPKLSKPSPSPACSHAATSDVLEQAHQIVTKGVIKPWERASRQLVLCFLPCVCMSHGAGGSPAFTSQKAEVSV